LRREAARLGNGNPVDCGNFFTDAAEFTSHEKTQNAQKFEFCDFCVFLRRKKIALASAITAVSE
jgi:hypothetical protein